MDSMQPSLVLGAEGGALLVTPESDIQYCALLVDQDGHLSALAAVGGTTDPSLDGGHDPATNSVLPQALSLCLDQGLNPSQTPELNSVLNLVNAVLNPELTVGLNPSSYNMAPHIGAVMASPAQTALAVDVERETVALVMEPTMDAVNVYANPAGAAFLGLQTPVETLVQATQPSHPQVMQEMVVNPCSMLPEVMIGHVPSEMNVDNEYSIMTHTEASADNISASPTLDKCSGYKINSHGQYVCLQCKKSFARLTCINRHLLVHSNVRPHQCKKCGKNFKQQSHLSYHMSVHNTQPKRHTCNMCGKSFSRPGNLKEHVSSHHKSQKFHCELCKRTFTRKFSLKVHTAIHNSMLKSHKCNDCGASFPAASILTRHRVVHSATKAFTCTECGKKFRRKNDLFLHLHSHSLKRDYPCSTCGISFKFPQSLIVHRKIKHRYVTKHAKNRSAGSTSNNVKMGINIVNENRLPVENIINPTDLSGVCTQSNSLDAENLSKQLRHNLEINSLTCPTCGKVMSSSHALKVHQRCHTGVKKYQCDQCDQHFRQKAHLQQHSLIHSKWRPHVCEVCTKTFTRRSHLQEHMLVHGIGTVKKYVCSACGKMYNRASSLNMHKRTHTDVRPFTCTVCGLSFHKASILQGHAAVHSDIRPHSCVECGAAFKRTAELKRHMQLHQRKTVK